MKKKLDYVKEKGIVKDRNGITMIALIITVIVLLIIAGITIVGTIGPNGVITKARKAREEQYKAEFLEDIRLKISEAQSEKLGEATYEDIIVRLNEDQRYEYTIRFSPFAKLNTSDGMIKRRRYNRRKETFGRCKK